MEEYPHLAPELRRLAGDPLHLWGDARRRHDTLEGVIGLWLAGDTDGVTRAIARVDRAVRAGLAAVGLPMSPDVALPYRIVAGMQTYFAKAERDGIVLAADMIAAALAIGEHDRIFRAWVHEGVHARQPRAERETAEQGWRGYEEGLTEGLARLIVHERAGIPFVPGFFNYYVATYQTLAQALDLPVEALWRGLWIVPPGATRDALLGVIVALLRRTGGRTLSTRSPERIRGLADRLFANEHLRSVPDATMLRRLWEVTLR